MNVLFFVVNYEADDYLAKLVDSVIVAFSHAHDVHIDMHVLDNSQKTSAEIELLEQRIAGKGLNVTIHSNGLNTGYFGGLTLAQSLVSSSIDCVIYSNSDVRVRFDFFEVLRSMAESNSGVIAPAILSIEDGFDQNPKYLHRITKEKLLFLKRIYSSYFYFIVFIALARCMEIFKGHKPGSKELKSLPANIYAPHGALFVFSDVIFFNKLPAYPCFLFGEELFVAEEAKRANVRVRYEPSICVYDSRHASVSSLSINRRRGLMLASIEYLLDKYY